jgi:hypothetical protein
MIHDVFLWFIYVTVIKRTALRAIVIAGGGLCLLEVVTCISPVDDPRSVLALRNRKHWRRALPGKWLL